MKLFDFHIALSHSKYVCTALICLVLLLANTASHAADAPKTFNNIYKAKLYGFNIKVTNSLSLDNDNNYTLLFKAESIMGSITETSTLKWNAKTQTVMPLHYLYERKGLGKNRTAKLSFDWQKKLVTNNVENTQWKMDITQKVQDKLSYQLQLQQDLINGQKRFIYQIADGGHLKEYRFEKVASETLDTPLGKVDTVKVKRSRENDKRITYAWLAPKLNHMLVRLQQEEAGDAYTIYIHSAEIDSKNIEHF